MILRCAALLFAGVFTSAGSSSPPLNYDEATSAQYIWLAQITGMDSNKIQNWTCGLACDTVKNVHNARVTDYGFPLQTLGVVAEYGNEGCIVAFRGSKTFLNYLLDDFDFIWTRPYDSCADCKVHKGFYDSWSSLRDQTLKDLTDLGCEGKELRVTGHSLGAAMAVLAAFELADTYVLKHIYTYGQPRVSNQAFVEAFQSKMASTPYFRVVEYMDAVPHLPPKGFVARNDVDAFGYQHPGPEVFYNATRMGSYRICPTGEDRSCSDQYELAECLAHTCCHCSYLGLNPCDINSPTPQCNEPKALATALGQPGQVMDVIV